MRRFLLILSVLVLMIVSFAAVAAPAKADSYLTAKVLASQLYIRQSGKANAGILSAVNWGDTLYVLGRNARGNFIKILAPDGTVGWVSVYWVRLSVNIPRTSIPIVS